MSKHEIKQENKELEGDPQIKARIRGLQFEMARKRMLADVPTRRRRDHQPDPLRRGPEVRAGRRGARGRGQGRRTTWPAMIRKIARKARVPVIENKPRGPGPVPRRSRWGSASPRASTRPWPRSWPTSTG